MTAPTRIIVGRISRNQTNVGLGSSLAGAGPHPPQAAMGNPSKTSAVTTIQSTARMICLLSNEAYKATAASPGSGLFPWRPNVGSHGWVARPKERRARHSSRSAPNTPVAALWACRPSAAQPTTRLREADVESSSRPVYRFPVTAPIPAPAPAAIRRRANRKQLLVRQV